MLGVVTNHVLQNCYPRLHGADFSIENDLRVLLMCMSIAAVNCFVMISGYFRICQSWKSFLYAMCVLDVGPYEAFLDLPGWNYHGCR